MPKRILPILALLALPVFGQTTYYGSRLVLPSSGGWSTPTELTISSGVITPTGSTNWHTVDTESDAAVDYIDTITATNVVAGFRLRLTRENTARVVWINDDGYDSGNVQCPGGRNYPIPPDSGAELMYDGSNWHLDVCGTWALYEAHTVNLDNSMSAARIEKEMTCLPQSGGGQSITFQFANGEYALTERIQIYREWEGANVTIQGNSGDGTSKTTSYNVDLNWSTAGTNCGFWFQHLDVASLSVKYLDITVADINLGHAVYCYNVSGDTLVEYFYIHAANAGTSTHDAVNFSHGTRGRVRVGYISSLDTALACRDWAYMYVDDVEDTGTINDMGKYASDGAVIARTSATEPGGTTPETEVSAEGAVIR